MDEYVDELLGNTLGVITPDFFRSLFDGVAEFEDHFPMIRLANGSPKRS